MLNLEVKTDQLQWNGIKFMREKLYIGIKQMENLSQNKT